MRRRDRLSPCWWLAADPEIGAIADGSIDIALRDTPLATILHEAHTRQVDLLFEPVWAQMQVCVIDHFSTLARVVGGIGVCVRAPLTIQALQAAWGLYLDSVTELYSARVARRRRIWTVRDSRVHPAARWDTRPTSRLEPLYKEGMECAGR